MEFQVLHPLYSPPPKQHILIWFDGYRDTFSRYGLVSAEEIVNAVTKLYVTVFENFKDSRGRIGIRNPEEIEKDLRMFGFDPWDYESQTPIRFYSTLRVPPNFRPPPTAGRTFPPNPGFQVPPGAGTRSGPVPGVLLQEYPQVIWPTFNERKRWLATYIRNSWSHGKTRVDFGIVTIENTRPGEGVPNFRIYLPVREYVRLIAHVLKYFLEHVIIVKDLVRGAPRSDHLASLGSHDYGRLIGFFQEFLRRLPKN